MEKPEASNKKSTTKSTTKTTKKEIETVVEAKEVPKAKPTKGPKTVIKEELVAMKDPLGIAVLTPKVEEPKEEKVFSVKNKVKNMDEVVIERYNPDVTLGLTIDDVEQRKIAGYANTVETGSSKSIFSIIFSNVVTLFNILMLAIMIWMISVGASISNFVFVVVVLANMTIGIIQEINAKKTIDKLSLLSAPTAIVVREKNEVEINVANVVIDDILFLSSGKQIPSDSVVRDGSIEVNESLLTGEADPIVKKKGDTLYSGSFVVSGSCYAQVSAVGKNNYIQKLTGQAKKYKKPKSELMGSLRTVIRVVGGLVLPLGALLFIMGWINADWSVEALGVNATFWDKIQTDTYNEFVVSTSAAMIGMIPSGLLLLTSMALAVGVIRLGQNNALVQELYCIEMLARVDTLCLDKTGTITDGSMTVRNVIEYRNDTGMTLKNIVSAMLNAQNDHNLTSEALTERFGLAKRIRHINLIPFSSARKYSAVQFEKIGTFAIGAPEFVIKENYDKIANDVNKYSAEGYRVLVIAHTSEAITGNDISSKIKPIALISIEDTIRPDAIETIKYFESTNVNIKVISGDNPVTVSRIAIRAGITDADKYVSLEGMPDKEVVRIASKYTVFGRVSPNQKKTLIEALKNNGHVVAMTGDGVNDILALREADTSIAMASGSEAARNVSHLVLLDSNFSSMPRVVAEGRRVINNVQKVAALFLTKTIFSILLTITAIIRKGAYPIYPSQLSIIELFVIGVPSLFITLEQNNQQVKGRFLWNVIKNALPGAIVVLINTLIIFAFEGTIYGINGPERVVSSTLIVLSATITCFTVLFRVCQPFNKARKAMFAGVVLIFILLVFLLPNFYSFAPFIKFDYLKGYDVNPLTAPQILLLVCLGQATYPLMYLISHLYGWGKSFVKWAVNILSKID